MKLFFVIANLVISIIFTIYPVIHHAAPIPFAHYRHNGDAILNDLIFTSGDVIRTETKETLCNGTFRTSSVRNVPESVKLAACAEYGISKANCTGKTYEIDHLISLEIGGSNDLKNLWPEPYAEPLGARDKDKIENELHRLVCNDTITLSEAQSCIANDWYACAQKNGILK